MKFGAALPRHPYIKICCIASIAEANLAISMGASAIGLVSTMPSGPGVIEDQLIAEITAAISPLADTFLLTARQQAEDIIEQQRHCRSSVLQLVDGVDHDDLRKMRKHLPGVKFVQVIHVADDRSVEEAASVSKLVDALLLDSGNQTLAVKELGGTGRTHDWTLSRRIRDETDIPVFLAGGLSATNIHQAMESVQPFGLDLCSSVRTSGLLDASKLQQFFAAVNEGTSNVECPDSSRNPGKGGLD